MFSTRMCSYGLRSWVTGNLLMFSTRMCSYGLRSWVTMVTGNLRAAFIFRVYLYLVLVGVWVQLQVVT
jgi:hypothetical protein